MASRGLWCIRDITLRGVGNERFKLMQFLILWLLTGVTILRRWWDYVQFLLLSNIEINSLSNKKEKLWTNLMLLKLYLFRSVNRIILLSIHNFGLA